MATIVTGQAHVLEVGCMVALTMLQQHYGTGRTQTDLIVFLILALTLAPAGHSSEGLITAVSPAAKAEMRGFKASDTG